VAAKVIHLLKPRWQGRVAQASEPIRPDNPLPAARNCLITPHLAWATREARRRLLEATVANVANFLAGRPSNVVN
jgi:glycerate dehydrogenase